MSPEERVQAYQEAVDVLNNYVAQEAAKIGNSQASLGTMAERVARPSGMTSGLANYTYNRTLRPTIDTLAANLTTSGYSQSLNKQLSDAIRAAKNRYEDAKNAYSVAATIPNNSNGNGSGWTESTGTPNTGEVKQPTGEEPRVPTVIGGYTILMGPSLDGSRSGVYTIRRPDGVNVRKTLGYGYEFAIDPNTGALITKRKS